MKKLLPSTIILLFCLVSIIACSDILDILLKNIWITSPEDGEAWRYDNISVSVSWSDPEIRTITCEFQTYNVKGGEKSHTFYDIRLFEGWNTIWVHASGRGITGSDFVKVYYDPYAPNLSIIGPTNNSEVILPNVTIHGMVSDNFGIENIYYKGDQGHYGSISPSDSLWNIFVKDLKNNANYTFKVVAVDKAGWMILKTVNFTTNF
ncbi:MAG: hypothetical protein JSV25_14700 [Spirochaetota bacterium]|nr:MAG: hypothetical protein JSV25_14700 [Spirochaetota bacterium]